MSQEEKHAVVQKALDSASKGKPKNIQYRNTMTDISLTQKPYQKAIDMLKKLPYQTSPKLKLELTMDTLQTTLQCVSEFWILHGKTVNLGADDLVPIFAYVILKAAIPNIYSEVAIISHFLESDILKGKFGYCFATFQIGIEIVMHLKPKVKPKKEKQQKIKSNNYEQSIYYCFKTIKCMIDKEHNTSYKVYSSSICVSQIMLLSYPAFPQRSFLPTPLSLLQPLL